MITRKESNELYRNVQDTNDLRALCLNDLFFLLTKIMNRPDIDNDFLYARCRDVERNPDGYLDLWAREHYKSTIITVGKTIQDVLGDPEVTVGIFSHTNSIAKNFLMQIKREFESNVVMQQLFPHICPPGSGEKRTWGDDAGILVTRKTNPKELTIESFGLVDSMPTGKHFSLLIYDDVVTDKSVATPEQIEKTTNAFRLSFNLGAHGGKRRFIGTRYHFNDTWGAAIRDGIAIPRIIPATIDGTEQGDPVFLTREVLRQKRRDMGPYIFGCLAGETQILMADFSLKPIYSVKEGDMVVGWTMEPGKRSKLVPTKVMATQVHRSKTITLNMETGKSIRCTEDHRWWSGRRKEDRGREIYRPASIDGKGLSALPMVLDLTDNTWGGDPNVQWASAYLSGIFDGEGTASGGMLHILQCEKTNQKICERIRECFNILKIDFGEHRIKGREHQIDFYIKGGRQSIFRFLMLCDPVKRDKAALHMMGARFGAKNRTKINSISSGKEELVYNIETETGNYIADGFCSKNCQMLQNPVADSMQGFKREWFAYYHMKNANFNTMNIYIVVDPASSKKKHSDYTAMWVVGVGQDGNYYVIDGVRDRFNLTERTSKLFELHRKYRPISVGYEQYGAQADIEHIQSEMMRNAYHFNIVKLGGSMSKEDRIRKLVPLFENGKVFFPFDLTYVNYEGKRRNLTEDFLNEEFVAFPVSTHDDMLDCLARIVSPELGVYVPPTEELSPKRRKQRFADTEYNAATFGMENYGDISCI